MSEDKYYVYRPMLDLIGLSEGTDKGDGYNETLAYGQFTDGDVSLVTMSLNDVDGLQTRMLAHPDNALNSSAAGRYQIVRTTLREIRKTLGLSRSALFDEAMQDRCACYLLGVRGIDKCLAGRLSEDTLINNLAKEWASLPTTAGTGYYGGQHSSVSVGHVREAISKVRGRHKAGQPRTTTVPAIPDKAEKPSTDVTSMIGGGLSLAASSFGGLDWRVQMALVGVGVVLIGLAVTGRLNIARSAKRIRAALQ